MTPLLCILLPALGALTAPSIFRRAWTTSLLIAVAMIDAAVALRSAFFGGEAAHAIMAGGYIVVDPTSRLFLVLINVLFLGVAVYVWSRVRATPELADGIVRFARLAFAFMAAANLVVLSNHLIASWLALELTTLAAAPLIVHGGGFASVRAAWRYFLFSSVGLTLTLLGFGCLSYSLEAAGVEPTLFLDELAILVRAPADTWRKLGLALVFLGYGTKLGLAPMYSWLPETYDEAPPAVTALLAAVQFNCALVALFRVIQVYRTGDQELISLELVAMGLTSMAVSTFNIIATHNYKRLIAYASINHVGVIAIGLGIGKSASYGLLLYVVSNAFIKAILFLTAGKIWSHYKTKDVREVAGLIKDLPYSGLFLMVGTFALLGFPPFGSFLGELLILSGLVRSGYMIVFVMFCLLLTMTFVATGRSIFPMIWGERKAAVTWPRQSVTSVLPKMVFLAALVSMGIYLPPPVNTLFQQVAASLEGR